MSGQPTPDVLVAQIEANRQRAAEDSAKLTQSINTLRQDYAETFQQITDSLTVEENRQRSQSGQHSWSSHPSRGCTSSVRPSCAQGGHAGLWLVLAAGDQGEKAVAYLCTGG